MQQFFAIIVFSAYILGSAAADPLTSKRVVCGSKAKIGEIDLMKPPRTSEKGKISRGPNSNIAFVPIETALNGSLNAPTAYHGAIAVTLPKQGTADYSGDCGIAHTKPVAAATPSP